MNQTPNRSKQQLRDQISRDMERYLAEGGEINKFPPEASGNPENPFYEQLKAAARKGGRKKAGSVNRTARQRDWASHRAI